jgi:hypothetical protein
MEPDYIILPNYLGIVQIEIRLNSEGPIWLSYSIYYSNYRNRKESQIRNPNLINLIPVIFLRLLFFSESGRESISGTCSYLEAIF